MVSSRLCCGDYAEVEDRFLGGDFSWNVLKGS
jgi:hypothetical protein